MLDEVLRRFGYTRMENIRFTSVAQTERECWYTDGRHYDQRCCLRLEI